MSVNGKRTEGSIKELIDSLHQDPLGLSKVHLLTCLPARESLKDLRGWGVRVLLRGIVKGRVSLNPSETKVLIFSF